MSLEHLTIYHCGELEHIVDIGDGSGGIELGNVFPKLKELHVQSCEKLEYIFGHINSSDDHDQNNNEIQLHLPALKSLKLVKLQSIIGICPKQYHTTFPPLKELELSECFQVDVKSIGDFTFHTSISRYQDSTTIKQFNGNMEHFLALERLKVSESNVESILCLNAESERQIDLGLQNILLRELPIMIYLFVGSKNAFTLKNLKSITIRQCEKLEIVFSTSVLRCLSQLSHLIIQECNELKHIIEDDDDIENAMNSKTCCFPMLKTLAVVKCNKLKSVFPISMSKELPKLEAIFISEADELEEIFKSVADDDHKVEIPNLTVVVFANLPNLCHANGIQFQTVENHFVQNCKQLSLTWLRSNIDDSYDFEHLIDGIDRDTNYDLLDLFEELKDMPKDSDFEDLCNENPQKEMNQTPATEYEFNENVTDLAIPSVATLPTNSQELISEQSTSQQHSLGKIDTTIKLSQGDYLEGSMSTISQTRNVPPIHVDLKQKGIQVSVEEGTASTSYANTITSSTHHLESELMNEQAMHQQRLRNQEPPLGEIDATMKSSQGIKISVEEGTPSTHSKSVSSSSGLSTTSMSETSSLIEMKQTPEAMHKLVENVPDLEIPSLALLPTNSEDLMDQQSMGEVDTTTKPSHSQGHDEDGDGKISIPSFSTVNTKPPTTKYVDIVDSQEIIAMEDINKLIEEDPLLALVALEKLLTGQVSISSVRVLLQELKTLMDSSSDLDHLVSNQESISKLNSLFHRLNQHQGMLTSDLKDFVEKVQNFFNENIIKHATSQQVLEKHNQLLDSKTDLMNKLWSVKSTQTHIDSETSTTNAQIHELSLQIDELRKKLADLENQRDSLKLVANKCDVQKMKLKAECTELVQQSKIFFSALALSDVSVREAEHARNLAKEGFANLKSSFPRF
ncbi:hypothetical protein P8452_19664 [Trifolium repens]|nr:hypothetical protein P8452_19664 [Trifolium repens]